MTKYVNINYNVDGKVVRIAKDIRVRFMPILTRLLILFGTSLPVSALITHVNTTNYDYS